MPTYDGRLELTWTNKHLRLLAHDDGTYEWAPSEVDALRAFIAAFVFQMGLVELRANLATGLIDFSTATRKEGRLRRYLDQRASELKVPTTGTMSMADFSAHADRLVREAIALLRAR